MVSVSQFKKPRQTDWIGKQDPSILLHARNTFHHLGQTTPQSKKKKKSYSKEIEPRRKHVYLL